MTFISSDFFKDNLRLPPVPREQWILHADLDSFYASVEVKLNPELKGKPVIVGPNPKLGAKRGVVLTCSYEARKFGVKSAMPILQAHKLCPDALYSFSGYKSYRSESNSVMEVFKRYCPNLQRVSIDEAYLNVSELILNKDDELSVKILCDKIQNDVFLDTELPVSIGASHTHQIAKIGSQLAKPKGTLIIPHTKFRSILDKESLKIISGVGKKSFKRLKSAGFEFIGDISKFQYTELPNKHLQWIWLIVNGIKIKDHDRSSSRSHSKERTFRDDVENRLDIRKVMRNLLLSLLNDLKDNLFKTLTIKLRDHNFKTTTRSFSFDFYINPADEKHKRLIIQKGNELLSKSFDDHEKEKFRLLGVKASNFRSGITQKSLQDFIK